MVKKRGLGKSLNALLSYTSTDTQQASTIDSPARESITLLSVDHIMRGKYQPRHTIDPETLEELANSIRQQGILQPLIVRPNSSAGGKQYEIVAGERRWQAAKLAGFDTVPVIIRDIPDQTAMAIALIENIQRENLNPIEEGAALDRLIQEFGMTHQEVAHAVGKSRTTVTNLLRLLVLPEKVQEMLKNGLLEMGHARTLVTLPHNIQCEIAALIVTKELSVRETENVVRRLQATKPQSNSKPSDPDILSLQNILSQQLKMQVAIQCNAKGKGKLVIHYRSLTELDHLISQFQPTS